VAARGFTLVELLVAMALLATLATLAAPGFGEYLRNCRRAVTVNALSHAVHAARALAAARGDAVRLCTSTDSSACNATRDWSASLLIEADAPDGAEVVHSPLRVIQLEAEKSRQTVRSNRDHFLFTPLVSSATTGTITVCDDRGSRAARAVIVSRTGRPRISDRDASGRALVCP
jgi:type IV fimbrial biogenesis protein FimT